MSNTIDIKGSWDWAISALVLMLALALIVRGGVRHVNRAAPIFLSVVILSIILLLLGIFLFAGGAYKGALSWSDSDFGDNVEPDFERTDARRGVPRRLHAIFVNRLWETRSWMVSFSSLSRGRTASFRTGPPSTETRLPVLDRALLPVRYWYYGWM